jgi:SAM-dependent methyltransferase
MLARLLQWLACPRCGGPLRLAGTAPAAQGEIQDGMLCCGAGHRVEIRDGVPRLAEAAAATASIAQTYDNAWGQFEYGDATWSMDADSRVRLFLDEIRLDAADLRGKVMLDAGCGTGVLAGGVSALGCDAVGTDVSEIVVRAQQHFRGLGNTRAHFVQADLHRPPFRDESFDIIYAGGVLHCNPDPAATFRAIAAKLKPGGRLWVWLYRRRTDLKYRLQQALRALIVQLPPRVQKIAVALWLPQAMLRQYVKTALGRCPPKERRSWRERYILLLDHYTPQYRWEHTEEEVRRWYSEAGLGVLSVSYNDWGFGVIGKKRSAAVTAVA